MTVLFADLVGFTARAESLDPEDVQAMLGPYHARLRDELERYGGTVEKFIGDAVMAVFGAPVAHEDDAERAVRAALAIRDWARGGRRPRGPHRRQHRRGARLARRAAGVGEAMVAGDVVNTAARLQSAAPVNGDPRRRGDLPRDRRARSSTGDAEPVEAKGKAEPVAVWEAVAARARRRASSSRRAAWRSSAAHASSSCCTARSSAPGPSARRSSSRSSACRGSARAGSSASSSTASTPSPSSSPGGRAGRCPTATASPSGRSPRWSRRRPGSSRATAATRSRRSLRERPRGCSRRRRGRVGRRASPAARRAAGRGRRRGDTRARGVRRLAPLLRGARRARPARARVRGPALGRRRRCSTSSTTSSTGRAGVPLLVVCTARPELLERRPGWGGGKLNATHHLARRRSRPTRPARLVARAARPGRCCPPSVQALLLERAGGNPLYAEEFARMRSRDGADVGELPLPESVQGLIAARLDALAADEKALLQTRAVVGRVFWLGGPRPLGGSGQDASRRRSTRSSARSSCSASAAHRSRASSEFAFRHGLVRDVAYGQIPRARRAELHRADRRVDRGARPARRTTPSCSRTTTCSALEYAQAAGQDAAALAGRAQLALREAGDRAVCAQRLRRRRRASIVRRSSSGRGRRRALRGSCSRSGRPSSRPTRRRRRRRSRQRGTACERSVGAERAARSAGRTGRRRLVSRRDATLPAACCARRPS